MWGRDDRVDRVLTLAVKRLLMNLSSKRFPCKPEPRNKDTLEPIPADGSVLLDLRMTG